MIQPVPIVMCKNEEVWIERVLTALVSVFPHVIVADTGSTDSTLERIAKVPGVRLMQFDNPSPDELGQVRWEMQYEAARRYGAERVILVDGDELYPTSYLRFIRDNPMPLDAEVGYTRGVEVEELPNGEIWLYGYDGMFNRECIWSVFATWTGKHPYESPMVNRDSIFCYDLICGLMFHHLHHTRRSSKDDEVYLRIQKRHQFSMRDIPERKPERLWLRSEKEYVDE